MAININNEELEFMLDTLSNDYNENFDLKSELNLILLDNKISINLDFKDQLRKLDENSIYDVYNKYYVDINNLDM